MRTFQQVDFSAGELDPKLHARRDTGAYARGLKTCKNFIPDPLGPLYHRTGTKLVRETKDSSKASRLVPFKFGDDQNLVLEFGNLYIRFHMDGGTIESAPDVPYEVVTTYTEAQLPRLKFAQSGDTVYIVHPDQYPRVLTRNANDDWDFEFVDFSPQPTSPSNIQKTMEAADADHPIQPWSWAFTAVNDAGVESEPGFITDTDTVLYTDRPVRFTWDPVPTAAYYRIYRGNPAGLKGLVGIAFTEQFVDHAQEADFGDTQTIWDNPFTNGYPSTVAFFEDRLVFGNTYDYPAGITLSETGLYVHVYPRILGFTRRDDEPMFFSLASRKYEEIRSLLPLRTLIALTGSNHWQVSGAGGDPITPNGIPEARPQFTVGASWLDPLELGPAYLAAADQGNRIWEVRPTGDLRGLDGVDVTLFAYHLLRNSSPKEWAFQREPHSVAWVVLNDGTLLSMTRVADQENPVTAWAQHDTQGYVESVACVKEGEGDAVYFIVRRTVNGSTKRFVERLADPYQDGIDDLREACFLDCAVVGDNRNTGGTTMLLDNEDAWTAASELDVTRSSGSFTSDDLGDWIVLDPDGDAPIRLEILSIISSSKVRATVLNEEVPADFQNVATTDWAFARDVHSGLDHLEGEEVVVLADGNVQEPVTVSGGEITLSTPAVIVVAGLSYDADLELLDLHVPGSKVRPKNVAQVSIEVNASRGLYAGEDEDNLIELEQRQAADAYGTSPLATGVVEVDIESSWNTGGRVFIRQSAPLPLTILSVTRHYDVGDEK